jgi:hypothetical protein
MRLLIVASVALCLFEMGVSMADESRRFRLVCRFPAEQGAQGFDQTILIDLDKRTANGLPTRVLDDQIMWKSEGTTENRNITVQVKSVLNRYTGRVYQTTVTPDGREATAQGECVRAGERKF